MRQPSSAIFCSHLIDGRFVLLNNRFILNLKNKVKLSGGAAKGCIHPCTVLYFYFFSSMQKALFHFSTCFPAFNMFFEFSHFKHTQTGISSKPLAQVSRSHRKKTGKKYPGSCFFLLLGQAGCVIVSFPVVIFHHPHCAFRRASTHWPGWFLHWSHSTYACIFFFSCQALLNYIVGRSDVNI